MLRLTRVQSQLELVETAVYINKMNGDKEEMLECDIAVKFLGILLQYLKTLPASICVLCQDITSTEMIWWYTSGSHVTQIQKCAFGKAFFLLR